MMTALRYGLIAGGALLGLSGSVAISLHHGSILTQAVTVALALSAVAFGHHLFRGSK